VPCRIALLAITACTATSALGRGRAVHAEALRARRSGLTANDFTRTALTVEACA
jgi:3-oxoacyl-[acyl-carrier-protein] synthase-1